MVGEFQFDCLRGLTLDVDGFPFDLERGPLAFRHVLGRVVRVDALHIEILLVDADDGEAVGDFLVVSKRDSWQSGFASANHVPTGCDQVDRLPQRRQLNGTVRIIG